MSVFLASSAPVGELQSRQICIRTEKNNKKTLEAQNTPLLCFVSSTELTTRTGETYDTRDLIGSYHPDGYNNVNRSVCWQKGYDLPRPGSLFLAEPSHRCTRYLVSLFFVHGVLCLSSSLGASLCVYVPSGRFGLLFDAPHGLH